MRHRACGKSGDGQGQTPLFIYTLQWSRLLWAACTRNSAAQAAGQPQAGAQPRSQDEKPQGESTTPIAPKQKQPFFPSRSSNKAKGSFKDFVNMRSDDEDEEPPVKQQRLR